MNSTMILKACIFIATFWVQKCASFHCRRAQRRPWRISLTRRTCTEYADCPGGTSIEEVLHEALERDDKQGIRLDAYVSAKRSFGNSLAFVDFLTSDLEVCQALVKRENYQGPHYQDYRRCLLPGTLLRIEGVAAPARNPGSAVLLVHRLKLLQMPRQPQHIRTILSLELPIEEVAQASLLSVHALEELLAQNGKYKAQSKSIFADLPALPQRLEESIGKLRYQQGFQLPQLPKQLTSPPLHIDMDGSVLDETMSVEATKELECPAPTAIMGMVQNRRRFEGNVTVFSIVDRIKPLSMDTEDVGIIDDGRLECILHPEAIDTADIYGNLLAVGSSVWVSGVLTDSGEQGRSLWVKEARLVRASWRPITLRYILDLLYEGKLSVEETADALRLSTAEAEELSEMDDLTARQWRASQISVNLQSSESRMANLSPEILEVLEHYESIRQAWPLLATRAPQAASTTGLQKSSPGSNWQRKKRPQLEWMVQEIASVAKSHPSFGVRQLHILDIGGGQGRLANYLARTLGDDVQVHVVDIAQNAIANGAMKAKRLNLDVKYKVADASITFDREHPVDVVVALHACGHLSDVALGHAIHHKAGFVICPCCFSSNPQLRVGGATVEEFLNISSTDWSALKYLAEVQGDSSLASKATHAVCAVRAEATAAKFDCSIQIKSFPIQYSTRNTVLVGEKVTPIT